MTIGEHERGVKTRFGKIKRVLDPGLHWLIPVSDVLTVVDLRPKDHITTMTLLTQDNYKVDTVVVVMFKVHNPADVVFKAPINFEKHLESLLTSEATTSVAKDMKMEEVLRKRDVIADRLHKFLNEQIAGWGYQVEIVKVKDMKPPRNVIELQEQMYEATVKKILEPEKAEISAEVYTRKAEGYLGVLEKYLGIITTTAKQLSDQYGSTEVRDILFILLEGSLDSAHPIVSKIKTRMRGEAISEAAKTMADNLKLDPRYGAFINAMQEMKSNSLLCFDMSKGLKGLDNQATEKTYGKND